MVYLRDTSTKVGVHSKLRQRRNYDLRVLENSCGVGDVVYLRDTSTKVGVHSKLRPPFIGPYLVIKAHPPLYMIEGKKNTQDNLP